MRLRLIWILWPGFLMAIPAVGVLFSMLTASDEDWWQRHFSQPVDSRAKGVATGRRPRTSSSRNARNATIPIAGPEP